MPLTMYRMLCALSGVLYMGTVLMAVPAPVGLWGGKSENGLMNGWINSFRAGLGTDSERPVRLFMRTCSMSIGYPRWLLLVGAKSHWRCGKDIKNFS